MSTTIDHDNAAELATAMNMVLEGEQLGDGLTAILMLLAKVIDHHGLDVEEVADMLRQYTMAASLEDPSIVQLVGEA